MDELLWEMERDGGAVTHVRARLAAIRDERIAAQYRALGHEVARNSATTQSSEAGAVEAWLIECEEVCNHKGRQRRTVVDAKKYDASSDDFWISPAAKEQHRITALQTPAQPTPAPSSVEGLRDVLQAFAKEGVLEGVREHGEGFPVEIDFDEDKQRLCLTALNEGGNCYTSIDLLDLFDAIVRAALAQQSLQSDGE